MNRFNKDFDDVFKESEMEDAEADARWDRQHERKLARHPDCRDPDHPGCDNCSELDTGDTI